MAKAIALVTGAGGELGRVLIPALEQTGFAITAVDLVEPPEEIRDRCVETV